MADKKSTSKDRLQATPEVCFMWKVFATVEGCEEEGPRLLTPWADPKQYEMAFDFQFKTVQEALDGLDNFDAKEEAMAEGWVLVTEVTTPKFIMGSAGTLKTVV